MTAVNLKTLLTKANRNNYSVAGLVVISWEDAIAYTEAAQYSVPSIGGKDGGASDAIDHEKTGLICDGNNLDAIYFSMNSILENKKYLEYGKNAKEFVTKFYWSNIVKKYKDILN